jgi:enoyl-CoA hydratase
MIEIKQFGEVALLRMCAGKANAMNMRLLDALHRAIDDVRDARALVITGEGRAFSAGLALPELVELSRADIAEMIDRFEQTMRHVLTFPRATVAAINGHAFAGGCVLALMCDVRVMAAGDAMIGLNEVQLGIGLPAIVIEPLRARVSPSALGVLALEGRLLTPDAALALHVVDEVIDRAVLHERALAIASARATATEAYTQIKGALLAPVVAAFDKTSQRERELWVDTWFCEDAQRLLRAAVDRITKRLS